MESKQGDFITNRAPICRTCKYYRVRTFTRAWAVPVKPWWAFWREQEKCRTEEVTEMACSIARDPVTGILQSYTNCLKERQRLYGCGPEGRNYVANPDWIADMKSRGLEVHPDLMAMMEDAK